MLIKQGLLWKMNVSEKLITLQVPLLEGVYGIL